MLNSYSSGAFQISCLRFLNTFVETASNFRERVYIQAELEDAGFDISHLKKLVSKVRFYCATLNGLCVPGNQVVINCILCRNFFTFPFIVWEPK